MMRNSSIKNVVKELTFCEKKDDKLTLRNNTNSCMKSLTTCHIKKKGSIENIEKRQ